MSWEIFNGIKSKSPRITVTSTGQINFNAAAVDSLGLSDKSIAVLYYNKGDAQCGIRIKDREYSVRTYFKRIKFRSYGSSAFIDAIDFFDHFNIQLPLPGREASYKYEVNEQGGMVILGNLTTRSLIDE
jgi:hypothetical protein